MHSKLTLSLLYDFYGGLLTSSQQKALELYVNDDLSLSETAGLMGLSRQGVRDALNRASKKMEEYENTLHLLSDYRERREALEGVRDRAKRLEKTLGDEKASGLCREIISLVSAVIDKEER